MKLLKFFIFLPLTVSQFVSNMTNMENKDDNIIKELISASEFARAIGVTTRTFYRYVKPSESIYSAPGMFSHLPFTWVGGRRYWYKKDLTDYLKKLGRNR